MPITDSFSEFVKNMGINPVNSPISLTITPIKKGESPARRNYDEQMVRHGRGELIRWTDAKRNSAVAGDYFGFWNHGENVIIHQILDILPPTEKMDSWDDTGRNVVQLSEKRKIIQWDVWLLIGGWKRCMGTSRVSPKNTDLLQNVDNLFKGISPIISSTHS